MQNIVEIKIVHFKIDIGAAFTEVVIDYYKTNAVDVSKWFMIYHVVLILHSSDV